MKIFMRNQVPTYFKSRGEANVNLQPKRWLAGSSMAPVIPRLQDYIRPGNEFFVTADDCRL
jgi:hypothetical protein